MKVGAKVVLRGQKITGTFRQFLGENDEDMVILLTKPQQDGAQTIISPTSEVEVLNGKVKSEPKEDKEPKETKKKSSKKK